MRSEPEERYSVFKVNPVVLHFDNRPMFVKIKDFSGHVDRAIVKGNTVEVSINQPAAGPPVVFKVKWFDRERELRFTTDPNENIPADFVRANPPDGSSIVGVDTIRVLLSRRPIDAKYYNHASESFGKVTRSLNSIQFVVPHPIKEPSISFTVSWTGKDGLVWNSKKLTYTNEDMPSKE